MISLIKNEFIKLLSSKKLLAFMAIILIFQLILTAFTFGGNIFNGQTYPLSILGILASWLLPLFLIVIVAEIITEDYAIGMLALTLIHPVSRFKLLAAKALYLLLLIVSILLLAMLSAYLIGTVCFGWAGEFAIRGVTYSAVQGFLITAGSYLISAVPLFAFSSLIMLLALLLQSSALVVGTAAGMLFTFYILGELISELQPYFLTSYFSYFSHIYYYLDDLPSLWAALGAVGLYGLIPYLISIGVFYRRDLTK